MQEVVFKLFIKLLNFNEMKKHLKIKATTLSFIVAISLVNYPTQASRWTTIADYDDPMTGCHISVRTCERGFGFAFCEVGGVRTTTTCPSGR
jgi:hypothetical protein